MYVRTSAPRLEGSRGRLETRLAYSIHVLSEVDVIVRIYTQSSRTDPAPGGARISNNITVPAIQLVFSAGKYMYLGVYVYALCLRVWLYIRCERINDGAQKLVRIAVKRNALARVSRAIPQTPTYRNIIMSVHSCARCCTFDRFGRQGAFRATRHSDLMGSSIIFC